MAVHLTPDSVMALREELDTNRDGQISLHEFLTAVQRRMKRKKHTLQRPEDRSALLEAWRVLLEATTSESWREDITHLFRKLDADGSVSPVRVREEGPRVELDADGSVSPVSLFPPMPIGFL